MQEKTKQQLHVDAQLKAFAAGVSDDALYAAAKLVLTIHGDTRPVETIISLMKKPCQISDLLNPVYSRLQIVYSPDEFK